MKVKTSLSLDLKHRPKILSDLFGQDTIIAQLRGSFKRFIISQRYLLFGPSGSGKTTIARMIARYVNCESEKSIDPCGKCRSCKLNSENIHPDVTEINFANQRSIDDMRTLIGQSHYAPQSNFRVYILDELHAATPQAKQAFLKPLEEPPPNTIWILATTNPEKLPNTIRGRCTQFKVKPVLISETSKLIRKIAKREKQKISKKVAIRIAELVRGEPRSALVALENVFNFMADNKGKIKDLDDLVNSALEDILEMPPYAWVLKWLTSVYKGQATGAIRAIENVDNLDYFVKLLIEYHTQTCYSRLSSKLKLGQYNGYYRDLKDYDFDIKHAIMGKILTILVKTSSEIKNYLVDAKFLTVSATLECINLVKRK